MTFNVYEQYFEADAVYNEVPRHAAKVMLIALSEQGAVRYEAAATFFPHNDPEDFAVSYDAYVSEVLYAASGRRSKKREAALLLTLQETVDALAERVHGTIFWDRPLTDARRG